MGLNYRLNYDVNRLGNLEFHFQSNQTPVDFYKFQIQNSDDLGVEHGYEDTDKAVIYPTLMELHLTNRRGKNKEFFKKCIDLYKYKLGGFDFDSFVVIIKRDGVDWLKLILDSVESDPKGHNLKMTLSSGVEYLKKLRVDNPYLIKRLEARGSIEAEQLRDRAGNYLPGWAYGFISDFRLSRGYWLGFVLLPARDGSGDVLSLSVDDNPGIYYNFTHNVPHRDRKIGRLRFMDFIREGIRMLNPLMQIDLTHNWTFGTADKTLEDVWAYDVYRTIFGRTIIILKSVWVGLSPQKFYYPNIWNSLENVFEDDTYIVFKVSFGTVLPGSTESKYTEHLKKFMINTSSQLYLESLNSTSIFKKAYYQTETKTETDIVSYSERTLNNRIDFIKVTYRNISARRGVVGLTSGSFENKIEYDLIFNAQSKFDFDTGVETVNFDNEGNLFYYASNGDPILFSKVHDPDYPNLKSIVELVCQIEYDLSGDARDSIDVTFNDVDVSFNKIYKMYNNGALLNIGYPLTIKRNLTKGEAVVNMIQTRVQEPNTNTDVG